MVDWTKVDEAIATLGFYLTTTSQSTLIFLTLFFVQRNLGYYKYLILMFSIVGIMFASFEFVVCPILHSYNSGFMFFTVNTPLDAPNEVLKIMLVSYAGFYAATISLLAVQFIYRYFAVFDAELLKYFKGRYFFGWILYVAWFGVEWGLGLYVFADIDSYSKEYMRPEMTGFYNLDISKLPCFAMVVYEDIPNSTHSQIRWWNLMSVLNMTFVMAFQYTIMIVCGRKLYYNMNAKISMLSKTLRKLHRQIFKTLMLQITTATVVLFSPIIFVIYSPLFDLEMSLPTGVFLWGFTLYPALDAVILMYIVTDYRKAFLNVTKGLSRKSRSTY